MITGRLAVALCLLLCCTLFCACGTVVGSHDVSQPTPSPRTAEVSADTGIEQPEHMELPYPDIRIYLDSLLWDRGFVREGQAYLPLSLFCRELNMSPVSFVSDGVLTVQAQSMELSAREGEEYMTVNGRYIYTPGGFVMVGDEPYIPIEAARAMFNAEIEVAEDMSRVELSLEGAGVITGGSQYYTLSFDSTEVFWLSRIIFAEATDEPLAGRIAVGNVVLNRVAHEEYPDNIYDVIFDTKGGVQFDTTLYGDILNDADELSVAAAYMALDGVNTAGNSLFFVNPDKANDGWFRSALEYVTTIGKHDFYTIKGA